MGAFLASISYTGPTNAFADGCQFLADGTGEVSVQDGTVTSGLLIDNVIPEPGAVAGVIEALAGAVALRRRSIKKQ